MEKLETISVSNGYIISEGPVWFGITSPTDKLDITKGKDMQKLETLVDVVCGNCGKSLPFNISANTSPVKIVVDSSACGSCKKAEPYGCHNCAHWSKKEFHRKDGFTLRLCEHSSTGVRLYFTDRNFICSGHIKESIA